MNFLNYIKKPKYTEYLLTSGREIEDTRDLLYDYLEITKEIVMTEKTTKVVRQKHTLIKKWISKIFNISLPTHKRTIQSATNISVCYDWEPIKYLVEGRGFTLFEALKVYSSLCDDCKLELSAYFSDSEYIRSGHSCCCYCNSVLISDYLDNTTYYDSEKYIKDIDIDYLLTTSLDTTEKFHQHDLIVIKKSTNKNFTAVKNYFNKGEYIFTTNDKNDFEQLLEKSRNPLIITNYDICIPKGNVLLVELNKIKNFESALDAYLN